MQEEDLEDDSKACSSVHIPELGFRAKPSFESWGPFQFWLPVPEELLVLVLRMASQRALEYASPLNGITSDAEDALYFHSKLQNLLFCVFRFRV